MKRTERNTIGLWRMLPLMLFFLGAITLWGQNGLRPLSKHVVRSGETLYSLAKAYDTTVEKIYELNPWARNGIRAGEELLIRPGQAAQKGVEGQSSAPASPKATGEHVVEAGETLYRIALRYGLSEEEIKRANPSVSAEHLPIGYKLVIPRQGVAPAQGSQDAVTAEAKTSEAVRVTLMLPISESARYLEYYEGFLMGLMDLKKDGISVELTVLDTPTDEEFDLQLTNSAVRTADLVIGGVNEHQTDRLAATARAGYYVIPFSTYTPSRTSNSRIVRLNQAPQEVADDVVETFLRRYRDRTVCFVRRGMEEEHPIARELRERMRSRGLMYKEVNLDRERIPTSTRDMVVVPTSPSLALAQRLLSEMPEGVGATIFGYPQWQSYGESFVHQIGKWYTTLYSTFFFDVESNEGRQFITKYNAWYSKKVSADYPKMSVMGYDVARYFIRSYSQYRQGWTDYIGQLPSDGLQLDIKPQTRDGQIGWVNSAFYLINTSPDGGMSRVSIY